MFNSILDTIILGNFKRDEMLEKINYFYLYGEITAEEADTLRARVAEYMNTDSERPEMLEIIRNLSVKIEALAKRVAKLEQGENTPDTETTYEKWEKWDGISKKYQFGAIVEHNGKLWENILKDKQNTWEPGVPGTEALWRVYEVTV